MRQKISRTHSRVARVRRALDASSSGPGVTCGSGWSRKDWRWSGSGATAGITDEDDETRWRPAAIRSDICVDNADSS